MNAHSIQQHNLQESTPSEVETTRNKALTIFSIKDIEKLTSPKIEELQSILQHGSKLGIWETPRHWLPPGRKDNFLSIDLSKRILHNLPKDYKTSSNSDLTTALKQAVITLTQYLILIRIGPAGMGKRGKNHSLDASTISNIAYQEGPALFGLALKKTIDEFELKDKISPNSIRKALNLISLSDMEHITLSLKKRIENECNRMLILSTKELWHGSPELYTISKADAIKNQPKQNDSRQKIEKHKPFPDDYLAEMGRKSLWLIHDLAPNILKITERLSIYWENFERQNSDLEKIHLLRYNKAKEILSEHRWIDSNGHTLGNPPFELKMPKIEHFKRNRDKKNYPKKEEIQFRWPPKSYRDLVSCLGLVQMAHHFVVALSMGSRQSETLGLKRNCIKYAMDGRAYSNGKTFKLVETFDGEERDWLLPNIAVKAIEQQCRLVSLAEKISDAKLISSSVSSSEPMPTHLWAEISAANLSDSSKPLRDINKYLQGYASNLNMSKKPGGQNIRSHRFRKTLARLVALALTQGPRILMDVFGHKSIEMTLYYILTDKDLMAETETVARELRIMRAKEIVERIVESQIEPESKPILGGYGGLGAITLNNAVQVYRDRVHRRGEDWGQASTYELAELLTMQGTSWEQVRRGVLCTKFIGEAGPCNKSKGRPEPSKCQSSCSHRLEEAFLREDVDATIEDAIKNYEYALLEDEQLVAAHWAAQIRTNVVRFSDLKNKWITNSTVHALLTQNTDTLIP